MGGAQKDDTVTDCISYNLKVPLSLCANRFASTVTRAQRAPMELINWPYKNSARHDMCGTGILSHAPCFLMSLKHCRWLKWTTDRFGRPDQAGDTLQRLLWPAHMLMLLLMLLLMLMPLPTVLPVSVDEGAFLRWNADPFDLDGGDGASETDPGASAHLIRGGCARVSPPL